MAKSDPYPRTRKLQNGKEVTLNLMTSGDADRVLKFAQSLSEDDVLFLQSDITQPEGMAYWVSNIEQGSTHSLLAEVDGSLAGYASVHQSPARWTRRVGEIRINVGPSQRGTGIGRMLTSEAYELARSLGLKKLSAQMTMEQQQARKVFARLGFQVEAVLADWVEDRKGRPHDLLIMAYDLDGLTDRTD